METQLTQHELAPHIVAAMAAFDDHLAQIARGARTPAETRAALAEFGIYVERDASYLVRIRCAAGLILPAHLRAIACIAEQVQARYLHITTRQELQIHGVAFNLLRDAVQAVYAAHLRTRGAGGNAVRNITAPSDAGVAHDEVFDVMPHALALNARLGAASGWYALPRKFKIAFSATEADRAHARCNDLAFVARVCDGARGFGVYVAGGMGRASQLAHCLHAFVPEGEVGDVAASVIRVFDKHGNRQDRNRARLRFLWNETGAERFCALYHAERAAVRAEVPAPFAPAELPDPAIAPAGPVARARQMPAAYAHWRTRYVQPQRQAGLNLVTLPVYLGNLTFDAARAIATCAEQFGNRALRLTMQQNVVVCNVPDTALAGVYACAENIAPLARLPALLGAAITCTGATRCTRGICNAPGMLRALIEAAQHAPALLDAAADVRICISGCPNACAQHLTADLGLCGMRARGVEETWPAYAVYAGARHGTVAAQFARWVGDVPARCAPAFILKVLATYAARKTQTASFAAFVDHGGAETMAALCAQYQAAPVKDTEAAGHTDWEPVHPVWQ
jgi:sulfite reductase (ferredoxin)